MLFRSRLITLLLISFCWCSAYPQSRILSLAECIEQAKTNNIAIKMAQQATKTQEELYRLSKKNILPKVDLLAGYNHLGDPIEVNLQPLKNSLVEGTATQTSSSAANIFQQITGNQLPTEVQQVIYQTSKDIISAVYPNYNPIVAKQDYFLAGVFLRQPIYLGGKLKAAQKLSAKQSETSKIALDNTEDLITYNIILQHLQLYYINSMLHIQRSQVIALEKNYRYAQDLLKAELIPPYMMQWSETALLQGRTETGNLELEKQNALLQLKQLIGEDLDSDIDVQKPLDETKHLSAEKHMNIANNTDLRILQSKKEEADIGVGIAKKAYLPNIFAIGNAQFFRKNLPLVTPPWMVGIEMQWTLFNGFENRNKIKIAQSLREDAKLLIDQKTTSIELASRVANNKITVLESQLTVLDKSRRDCRTTTEMVRKRMENSLSSVKDVNDAIQVEYMAEKAYYTALVAYRTAIITNHYLTGNLNQSLNVVN